MSSSKKKTDAKGMAAKAAAKAARHDAAKGRGQAPEPGREQARRPATPKDEHRMLTAAEYRALEKAAHALETALKIRRKYQFAVLNATECIEKNIDRIFAIARGE